MINKQDLRNETGTNFDQFNRVLGFDYNLASADNKWNAKFFYHQSFDKNRVDDEFATALSVNYQTIDWDIQAFTAGTKSR